MSLCSKNHALQLRRSSVFIMCLTRDSQSQSNLISQSVCLCRLWKWQHVWIIPYWAALGIKLYNWFTIPCPKIKMFYTSHYILILFFWKVQQLLLLISSWVGKTYTFLRIYLLLQSPFIRIWVRLRPFINR